MATAAITYTFVAGTTIESAEANTNFNDLVSFLNTSVMHRDASSAFTAVPAGPATDPTTANQLTRKAYVDAQVLTRLKDGNAADTSDAGVVGTVNHVTAQLLWQAGSTVGTTSGAGGITITYPTAFPTGVLTVVVTNGDTDFGIGSDYCNVDQSSNSVTSFVSRWYDGATGAVVASEQRRTNWIAIGW